MYKRNNQPVIVQKVKTRDTPEINLNVIFAKA